MSTEELQTAYDDAIKRVRGSVCHDLAELIEAYVHQVQRRNLEIETALETFKTDLRDMLYDVGEGLDERLNQA